MKDKITTENALARLMELCSRKEKSTAEIIEKLRQWGLENESEKIIGRLQAENFLNEERFTAAFVNDKIRFNKWGKRKVAWMLQRHRISEEIVGKALGDYPQTVYVEMVNDELRKKRSSLKKLSGYPLKNKLFAFAQQRGYEPDLVHRFFDEEGI